MNKNWLLAVLLSLVPVLAWGQFEEPLDPDQAFAIRAYAVDPHTVRAEWDIADGYYMYRKEFKFTTDTPGITIGEPDSPPGKIKEDEFFGKVESYRHKVAIDVPIERSADAPDDMVLTAVSRGCADMGICYPPHTQTVKVALPPMAAAETAPAQSTSGNGGALAALSDLGQKLGFGGGQEEFLEPDQAFAFTAEVNDGNTIVAHWDIADGYYLYREKFSFELKDADGVTLGTAAMPKGKEKVDEAFGRMEVYYHEAPIRLPLVRDNMAATEVELVANFQGCADAGFCYPPMTRQTSLRLPATDSRGTGVIAAADAGGDGGYVSEQDRIAQSLAGGSLWLTVLTFFGFGLLLAFTPCVFPMIPILSSIIVGQGEGLTTRRAFTMSLVYVLAMALTYTVAGIIAGLSGANLQAAFQNPWILSSFAVVFVLLSLSMFGFYELQLPASWQGKLTEISNRQRGGTLTGVGIMGFLSALIVGPCVAAPLAGALIYISQTGDAVLGGLALFALSMGMGAPLLAIGTSAGKLLPRAGGWMETVKAVFGVLLLAVAIWMLERIVPVEVAMLLWATLLIISAVYMGALDRLNIEASGWRKLWKGVGVVMLAYGGLLLVGVASGGKDTLQPLRGSVLAGNIGGGTAQAAHGVEFKPVKSVDDLNRELARASQLGRPVMLDFYADWCVSCKEMEKYTFSAPGVQQALEGAVLLQADVTANDTLDKALLRHFNLIGPPSMLFFDRQGREQRQYRLVGFLPAEEFERHARRAFQS